MDAALLARLQFAFTVSFHYLFPILSIGLGVVLVVIATLRLRRPDDVYDHMLRFWTHIFGVTFAFGVATGIVMEFQFGTNWARYSRFVGDIFGGPLAAEAVLAFFLESGFLAILLFGWDRVSRRVHWFATVMVALGATLSAFWIVVANSWQQTPAGYHIVGGRAELTDFWAAVFNPSTTVRYLHVITGAWVTGAFFVAGVSAWYLLKGRHLEHARRSLKIAIVFGLIAIVSAVGVGDLHVRQVAAYQPEKFAAMEGLFETTQGAPFLLLGYPLPEVGIPRMLSFMVHYDLDAVVLGLDAFPPHNHPPVAATAMSFHGMVWLGTYMAGLMVAGAWLLWRRKVIDNRVYLRLLAVSIPVPFAVNEIGWVTAEIGRQPWAVYHQLRTSEAFSATVPASHVALSLALFVLVYAGLFVLAFRLIRKTILAGPEHGHGQTHGQARAEASR